MYNNVLPDSFFNLLVNHVDDSALKDGGARLHADLR